jgi:sugar O-acyltransferase (sialic acid O-acetyltransferase NeuD family)
MSRVRRLYVLGAGGLAREMAQLALQVPSHDEAPWAFAGFIGSDANEIGRDLGFGAVVGDDEWLLGTGGPADLVVGIGHPIPRATAVARFAVDPRFKFPNLIHPTAVVDRAAVSLGQGNAITAGCVFTCDIRVGDFNLFNLQTTVGHDAQVGSSNVINPSVNISGGVHLADRILVGTGAQILEGRSIGSGAIVGAGAVVTKHVSDGATVVGVPARPLDPHSG